MNWSASAPKEAGDRKLIRLLRPDREIQRRTTVLFPWLSREAAPAVRPVPEMEEVMAMEEIMGAAETMAATGDGKRQEKVEH